MATLPAVSHTVRVDFHMAQAGASNIQVHEFFHYQGTLSTADATAWLGAMVTAWNTFIAGYAVTGLSTTLARLTDLSSDVSPQVENSTGVSGVDTAEPLNAGTAMVIKHHIVRRYRGGHPRVYLPGFAARHLTSATTWNGSFAPAIAGTYQTFINSCVSGTPVAAAPGTHVNVSYFKGFTVTEGPTGRPRIVPTPRATPIVDAIDNYSANPAPASQRRRNQTP